MKKSLTFTFLLFFALTFGFYSKGSILEIGNQTITDRIKEGDIIFQSSLSTQSKAIQLATKSVYSHCGIIFKVGNEFQVLEAVQPVKYTPLKEWIARGKDAKYVIKRLKNADSVLTPKIILKMKTIGKQFIGKNYDLTFEWSDDEMYCSELIWKIYFRSTGLEIGKLQKLSEFDLSSPEVKAIMKKRGEIHFLLNATVISPEAIFRSEELVQIQ